MNHFVANIGSSLLVAMCVGCAHPINISPDVSKIAAADADAPKIDKAIGYHISDQNKTLKVKTPGGGGDSVEYMPYNDLHAGIYRILSNTFHAVYIVKDPQDRNYLQDKSISLIFVPMIRTTSSSRNNFFWAPTDFSVTIDCIAQDANQQTVWKTTVKGDNDLIAVSAVNRDPGAAGRSAAEKALTRLQAEMLKAPELR